MITDLHKTNDNMRCLLLSSDEIERYTYRKIINLLFSYRFCDLVLPIISANYIINSMLWGD